MRSVPGVTVDQDGNVALISSERITIIRLILPKQKATITGRISNPFGLFQYTMDFQDTEYVSDFRMKQEANVTGITFSYRINNYRPSQKRNEQIQENMNPGGLF